MGITGDDVVALLGRKYASKEVRAFLARIGSKPVRDEFWATCEKHHFALGIEEDGRISEAIFPDAYEGEIGLLPFGLAPGTQASVRKKLGAPADSPQFDEDMFEVPNDVFDLPDHTVAVSFTAGGKSIAKMIVRPAADRAEERAARRKAGPSAPTRAPAAPRKGAWLDALVRKIETGRKRKKPKRGAAALLARPLPDDLRRFLAAHAAYDHGRIDVGDFKLEDDVIDDEVPGHGELVVIGRTAGGDLWVVRPSAKGKTAAVSLALHEEAWALQKGEGSLDAQLAACAKGVDADSIDIDV